jgi:hypothetical protein
MTPGAAGSSSVRNPQSMRSGFSNREPQTVRSGAAGSSTKKHESSESYQKRMEKKAFYASLMKEAKEKEAELAQKYRDRAKERRETNKQNKNEYQLEDETPFRTPGPVAAQTVSMANRRQAIEESKYLGGDLEHTHLVKGLDYALLQKVRSELNNKKNGQNEQKDDDERDEDEEGGGVGKKQNDEQEDDSENEDDKVLQKSTTEDLLKQNLKPKILSKTSSGAIAEALNKAKTDETPYAFKKFLEQAKSLSSSGQTQAKQKEETKEELNGGFKTVMGRNVCRILFENAPPKLNELFLPRRMAYIVDLCDDETGGGIDSEIPLTSIRSKAECSQVAAHGLNPSNSSSLMSTNDIVINKLTQILSYLRHGGKKDAKKLKKKQNLDEIQTEQNKNSNANTGLSIYDDVGDYVPELAKKNPSSSSTSKPVEKKNYFGKNEDNDLKVSGPSKEAAIEFIKNVNEKYAKKEIKDEDNNNSNSNKKDDKQQKKSVDNFGFKFDPDSYSECYPGMMMDDDGYADSDDEDNGPNTKKGLALGDAASGGVGGGPAAGKLGKNNRMQQENGRIEKEWTQISRLIEKRKTGDNEPGYKRPKY